ncbi:AraC family transcriptional regulator [Shewanella mesophila]|nr:AraC family transcriptional regulator [Shewanella mesophila]
MVGDQSYPAYELGNILTFIEINHGIEQQSKLCAEIGIGVNELKLVQFVSVWQVDYAMGFLSKLDSDPELGAKLGATYRLQDLDFLLGHLSKCGTLGDCLDFVVSSPALVGSVSDTLVTNTERYLHLRWLNTGKIVGHHFGLQFQNSVCSMLALARQLTSQPIKLENVSLVETESDSVFLQSFTQAKISYESEFYEWSIDRNLLSLPITFDFKQLSFAQNDNQANSFIELVLNEIRSRFPHPPKLEQMAQCQQISSRTFRRRLACAGTSYQRLVDQVRCQTAIALIVAGEKSVVEISEVMGFSDVSHFRQSFKHWLGYPPGYFIRQL